MTKIEALKRMRKTDSEIKKAMDNGFVFLYTLAEFIERVKEDDIDEDERLELLDDIQSALTSDYDVIDIYDGATLIDKQYVVELFR